MTEPAFLAYVDESGDDGFEEKSSDWLVLSAIITPAARDNEITTFTRSIRTALEMQDKQLIHFSDLKHEKRLFILNEIANSWLKITNVVVNKRRLTNAALFSAAPFRLYKYAARLLTERISWFCRDSVAQGQNSKCKIIFEHRKRLSFGDVKEYFSIL